MARNSHVCCIVPEYLLRGIAESTANPEEHRQCARESLAYHRLYCSARKERFAALALPRGSQQHPHNVARQSIVPEQMLRHIAEADDVDDETKSRARAQLEDLQKAISSYKAQQGIAGEQTQRTLASAAAGTQPDDGGHFWRAVYDAQHNANEARLPGKVIRAEGQGPSKDKAVNEAFDNVGKVLDFYLSIFKWRSIDNNNMHVLSSVHFAKNYENAFWDPLKMQMVFGDGGQMLYNFTKCIDVIGHEMTHAVTEHTSPLDYEGQSGALNEHVSDVFGIMVKQKVEDETAEKADWLIGEGCLLPEIKGVALRSMKAPGTAYDDPRMGKDPQPDNFSGYYQTEEDEGGVHIFSGIPNKAFYLASVAFGGYSWEKAGQIWWKALNSGRVPAKCTFLQFADVTVDIAEELYQEEGAKIVRDAWNEVGVVRKGH
ncbi:metalloprotease [Coniochaeta sp. PMI_546]|nr:metalloprotease [Coniochaeta sp. PMI_546]